MKFIFLFFLLIVFDFTNAYAQCIPNKVDTNNVSLGCSTLVNRAFVGHKYKIRFTPMSNTNIYTFSTVGETTEDTEMYLYDDTNNSILAYNDDDSNCGGCKQSTITYTETTMDTRYFYIVLAKSGCQDLSIKSNLKIDIQLLTSVINTTN